MDPNRDGVIHDKGGNSISVGDQKGGRSVMKQSQDLDYSMAFDSTLDNDPTPVETANCRDKVNAVDLTINKEDMSPSTMKKLMFRARRETQEGKYL